MGGRSKRMRTLFGVLKDKVSLLKATFILASFHRPVLQATNHNPTDPPPEHTLDTILSLSHEHRITASAIVDAVLLRLHGTRNAFVSLKCLLTLHHILRRGSPDLIISTSPNSNESTPLNLANFVDESDSDTLELSKWARWYAQVIQQSLIVTNALRSNIYSIPLSQNREKFRYDSPIYAQTGTDLSHELNLLVEMIVQICCAPDSLHYQRMSIVYEVMRLVGEDYRITLRGILTRINQFRDRINITEEEEMEKVVEDLKRLEECKEKGLLMFLNKKSGDGTWDLITQFRRDVEEEKQRRLVKFQGTKPAESRLVVARGKRWLDVEWNRMHKRIGPP